MRGRRTSFPSEKSRIGEFPIAHLGQLPVEFRGFVHLVSGRILTEKENKPAAVDREGAVVPVHICRERRDW